MKKAVEYLRKLEWSMGNGQCPECHGLHEKWHDEISHRNAEQIGHVAECNLAAALVDLGEKPLMLGDFFSDYRWELVPFNAKRPRIAYRKVPIDKGG